MAVFVNELGNQTFNGTTTEYDQVDYNGSLSDYVLTQNEDGTVTIAHPEFGTDILSSIEAVWFRGENQWYAMDDALALQAENPTPGPIAQADLDFVAIAGQSNAGNMFWYLDDRTDLPQGNQAMEARMSQLTGFNTEIINASISASASNESATDRGLFWWDLAENRPGQSLLESVADIQASLTAGDDLDALIWSQGESDAYSIFYGGNPELQMARFVEATARIFEYFRSVFGEDLPIFIMEMGEFEVPVPLAPGEANAFDLVRDAQLLMAENDPNIFIGVQTEDMPHFSDGIHFNTVGYNAIGEVLAESVFEELSDGAGPVAPPLNPGVITGTNGDEQLFGTIGDDIIEGLGGRDIVIASEGNDDIRLGDDYDQVNYRGEASDYVFVQNDDGTVTVTSQTGDVDTLEGVDGFWFEGEQAWYGVETLVIDNSEPPTTGVIRGTDGDDQLNGTDGNDVFQSLVGSDIVFGSAGNDAIILGDQYDQVTYDGNATDYTFVQNDDGSVSVNKPDGSIDTLVGVDGFWFQSEAAWYRLDALVTTDGAPITGSDGNDLLNGTNGDDTIDSLIGSDIIIGSAGNDIINLGDGYDQVNYDGAASDYGLVRNDDGSFTVFKPDGSFDILDGVDGLWFQGEETWYSTDDASLFIA